jgi:hypothetical protein
LTRDSRLDAIFLRLWRAWPGGYWQEGYKRLPETNARGIAFASCAGAAGVGTGPRPRMAAPREDGCSPVDSARNPLYNRVPVSTRHRASLPFQGLAGRLSRYLGGGPLGFAFRSLYWRYVGRRFWPGEELPAGIGHVGIPFNEMLTETETAYARELEAELIGRETIT